MKKKIVLFSVIFSLLLILTGCGNKKAITPQEFVSIAQANNYNVSDATNQFSGYGQVREVKIASNYDYQIEFYVLNSESDAKSMYEYNKSLFEAYKVSNYSESHVDLNNYSTYSLQSSGYYMFLSRIDNTLVYVKEPVEYKSNIDEFIKKLGY